MIDYALILSRRYAGKEWTQNGDTYEGLTWLDDSIKPTKAKLDGLWVEVQNEILNEAVQRDAKRIAVLNKLGLTQDEAAALFS